MYPRIPFTDEEWQTEIDTFFETLRQCCDVLLTTGCSMHVHVSPSDDPEHQYTLEQVQQVLKATAYFHDAIIQIMPPRGRKIPGLSPITLIRYRAGNP